VAGPGELTGALWAKIEPLLPGNDRSVSVTVGL